MTSAMEPKGVFLENGMHVVGRRSLKINEGKVNEIEIKWLVIEEK